ncbi:MAG TPA: protein kinase [Candidatus Krumholzibacteria bacterium]|nr:protein kinase [Candidatus Krumholzibacteria bacterium]
MIGKTISHYQILEKLGEGGMGEVYKARDITLDRTVALKFLKAHVDDDQTARKRFINEAKTASALDHRNVATIYEIGQVDGGRTFIAMAFYGGTSLSDEIQRAPLDLTRALDLAIQVGEGLAEAHRHDIVHRDVKPANVIVTERDEAKILDFGLAKLAGQTRVTRTGTTMGTIGYMSPEQAQGAEVDRRTDIWALGALLYESLVGKAPFRGTHEQAIIYSILNEEPEPLTAQRAGLPLDIDRVIGKALAKDRAQRYQSMDDMLVDLRALRAGVKSSKSMRAHKRPSHTKTVAVCAALFLAGIAAGFGLSKLMSARESPGAAPRVSVFVNSGSDRYPVAAPDGKSVAFASSRTGVSRIWVKQIASGDEVVLTEGNDTNPRYSPDGLQLLFVRTIAGRTSLWRVSNAGGPVRRVIDDAVEGAWSPDGQRIAFTRYVRDSGEIWIAQADGSRLRRMHSEADRRVWGISWSPDGKRLLACADLPFAPVPLRFLLVSTDDGSTQSVDPELGLTQNSNPVWLDKDRIAYATVEALYTTYSGQASHVLERSLRNGKVRELTSVPAGCNDLAVLASGRLLLGLEQRSQGLEMIDNPGTASEKTRVLTRGGSTDRQPVFSPDGTHIVFSSNRTGNLDIWVVDVESGTLSRLTDDPGDDWDPAFLPDGRHILWTSNRTGKFEVWTAAIDGSGASQLSHTGRDAQNPRLTADGHWILFVNNVPPEDGVWRMRPDGSEPTLLARAENMPVPGPDANLFVAATQAWKKDRVLQMFHVDDGLPLSWRIPLVQRFDLLPGRPQWIGGDHVAYLDSDALGRVGVTVREVSKSTVGAPRALAGFDPLQPTETFDVTSDGTRAVLSVRTSLQTIVAIDNVPGINGPPGAAVR